MLKKAEGMAPCRGFTDNFVRTAIQRGESFDTALHRLLATGIFRSTRLPPPSVDAETPTTAEPSADATRTARRTLRAFVQSVDTIWAASDPLVAASPAYDIVAAETLLVDTAPIDPALFALHDPPAKKNPKRPRPNASPPPVASSSSTSGTGTDTGAQKRPRRVGPTVVDAAWLSARPLSTHGLWPCLTQRLWQAPRPSGACTLDADAFVKAVDAAAADLVRIGNAKWVRTGVDRVAVVYARPAFMDDAAAVGKILDVVWKPSNISV
jgi:hypothetical protein